MKRSSMPLMTLMIPCLTVLTPCLRGAEPTAKVTSSSLRIDFSGAPDPTVWSISGASDTGVRPGWLEWRPSAAGAFTSAEFRPGRGLDLATLPAPWEMRVRLALPARRSTFAVGFWGNPNETGKNASSDRWMQLMVAWDGTRARMTSNGGFFEANRQLPLSQHVLAAETLDLILQLRSADGQGSHWRLLVRPADGESRAWSFTELRGGPFKFLNPWGLAIEERQGFYDWLEEPGQIQAPRQPRTVFIDTIELSRQLTQPTETAPAKSRPFTPNPWSAQDYRAALNHKPQLVGEVNGTPIYTMGQLEFLGLPPDLQTDLTIQEDNTHRRKKIRPKRSSEISGNFIGTTPPRLPRSEYGDEFPWLPMHMIDGDTSTGWMGGGWVKVDLPRVQTLQKIVFWPIYHRPGRFERPGGAPAYLRGEISPASFDILVSPDARQWHNVAQVRDLKPVPEGPVGEFSFLATEAKMILIHIRDLHFGFAEVQVFNNDGRNVSLATNGANVLVGSTRRGPGNRADTTIHMWPMHWLLGAKWMRVGYWNDATNWSRVKGEYHLDPLTDAAIHEAAANGMKIVLTLGFGNLLYQNDGRAVPRAGEGYSPTWTYPVPTEPEGIEAFAKYCRFMAGRLGDTVSFYEIWNEMDSPEIRSCTPQQFATLVHAAATAIREVVPDAKIMLGGSGSLNPGYTSACLEGTGLAAKIDAIAYHPYQMSSLPEDAASDPRYPSYVDAFSAYQRLMRSLGFKGVFHANEQAWKAMYPQYKVKDPKLPLWSFFDVSELTKAKYLDRTVMIHTSVGVPVFWNESWTSPGSLVRHNSLPRAVAAGKTDTDPLKNIFQGGMEGMCPEASFYVMRTLSTAMDGAEPTVDVQATWSNLENRPVETRRFSTLGGNTLIAIWLRMAGEDDFAGVPSDLFLRGLRARSAVGIDVLNRLQPRNQRRDEGWRDSGARPAHPRLSSAVEIQWALILFLFVAAESSIL